MLFSASLYRYASVLRFSLNCFVWQFVPVLQPYNADCAAAAPSSLIVATCAPVQ